jgi:oligopeptidase A
MNAAKNPLLIEEDLPLFDQIKPEHVVPAVITALKQAEEDFAQLEKVEDPTWENLMKPMELIHERLHRVIGPVTHLKGVKDSKELRDAWDEVEPKIIEIGLKMKQNKKVYHLVKQLKEKEIFATYDHAQQRIIEKSILEAELAGIALEGEKRKEFNEIQTKLGNLQTLFQNNILDAINRYSLIIKEKKELDGLPESFLQLASQAYNQSQKETSSTPDKGPWKLSLEPTILLGVLKYCNSEKIRETLYRASIVKASSGENDNTQNMEEILRLRQKSAHLLGYDTYAEVSLALKMAPNVKAVDDLLEKLRAAAWSHGEKDLKEITELAASKGAKTPLSHWDIIYWAERLKESKYQFSEEEIRPYFQFPKVLQGLFDLTHDLFDVKVKKSQKSVPIWHPDVSYYIIEDSQGKQIAGFYLDPYSRPENKRGGAWMDNCLDRCYIHNKLQLPVAYNCCNMPPPIGKNPSLMTFREVETLFHEFGHALQHMLTRIDYAAASGINGIEWDAVEIASQFMENWCYHKATLQKMTEHIETKKPLPDALFEKIAATRTFRAGSNILRQVQFAMVDMQLHHRYDVNGKKTPFDIFREISKKTTFLQPLPEDRFLCSFSHIFGGGYAAGYYSYKWSEVLSSDAFSAFEEAGLDNEDAVAKVGKRYRETILAEGGGRDPMEVFIQFRKRPPTIEPLLKHCGLL